MPKAKFDSTQPHIWDMFLIANLKSYSTDLIPDFKKIYQIQLDRFKDMYYQKDFEDLQKRMKALEGIKVSVQNESRVYIVSGDQLVLFAMYNMDKAVLNNFQFAFDIMALDHPEWVTPNYINTIFIFEKSRLVYQQDIPTKCAIELAIVFQKENLLNTGAFRDAWYGKPRRDAKRLSDLP